MKKIILIASLIIVANTVKCQRNTMINTKDIAPLSFGVMPVVFASENRGPGIGLELNTRYAATKNVGVSLFGRMKSIVDDNTSYADDELVPSGNATVSRNVFAIGTQLDYHLLRAINVQLRGGYEVEADPVRREMTPRLIYGGGLIFNLSNSQAHKIGHSLRVGVDFETNRTISTDIPTADFSDFPYSQGVGVSTVLIHSYSIQVGWNFQFYSIKRKR